MPRHSLAWPCPLVPALVGVGLMTCLLAPAGCDLTRQIALQTAPKTEKVAAEFNRLPGKKVLVFIWVPPEIKWDYPHIRLDLAAHVGGYLAANVKGLTTIDPRQVESYLEKSSQFEADPVEVGRHFHADMVVHLAVYQFSVRDPGMAHYYRGRLASSVEVHDLTAAEGSPKRFPLHQVEVVYPEKDPVSFANARPEQIRQATYEAFTLDVGKKFHSYERPLD